EFGRRRRVKPVLHDKKLQILKCLFQHIEIRKRNNGVRRNDPKRTDLLRNRRFDNVRIRQPPGRWNPARVDSPDRREFLAVIRALKLSIAWKTRRKASFTRAHRVALPSN